MKACATRLCVCVIAGDGTRPAHFSELSMYEMCVERRRRMCVVNAAHDVDAFSYTA